MFMLVFAVRLIIVVLGTVLGGADRLNGVVVRKGIPGRGDRNGT